MSDTVGWIYVQKQMRSAAIPHLESSVAGTPEDPVAHYHLGIAYLRKGQKDQARQAFNAVKAESKWHDLADLWAVRTQAA